MITAVIGIAILVISATGAIVLAKRNTAVRQRQGKILLFGLYFWVIAFAQLFLVAIVYALYTR
jgi:hypothetical protein